MKSEIRTFAIRDETSTEDEARVATFLHSVEVHRIETAYCDGAWRILVLFDDLRLREETAQIHSAIVGALNQWRIQTARTLGIDKEQLLPEAAMSEIARFAPTTPMELSVLTGSLGCDPGEHAAAIATVVRHTLEDLTA